MPPIALPLRHWRWVWEREGKLAFVRRVLGPLLCRSYRSWIAKNEPGPRQLSQQRLDAAALPYRPLLCVVISAGGITSEALDLSIRSVVNQSYDRWELHLAGQTGDGEARRRGEAWAEKDPRIRIAGASGDTDGVPCAKAGEGFVASLAAGDTLAPHALFEVARVLNECRAAEVIYFDEDTLSADGRTRSSPFFKPGWSPEMLHSINYLAHAFIARSLLAGISLGSGAGKTAWDLALRCSERAREVRHVAKVLYHARAGAAPGPPTAEDLRALEEHCTRIGIPNPRATIVPPGVVRLTWPAGGRKVSIIIPNKDRVPLLRRCITSLFTRTAYPQIEILIVDTGSTDIATRQYYATLASDPRVRMIEHPGTFNFSAVNNAGVRAATGDLLLFLNNDTEAVDPDWLEELARWAGRPEIGAVGAKLLYPDDGTVQHAGVVIGMYGLAGHIYRQVDNTHAGLFGSVDWYRNYLAVTGACMMMRREVFDEVGGFDEAYQVAFSDIEICLRIHTRGYRIVYTPFARLRHYEGATRGNYYPDSDTRLALEQMRGLVASGDPYFHPNLSHESLVPMLPRWGDRPREVLLKRRLARARRS